MPHRKYMESQTKSWIYLLPNGETAADMKQGTERMSKVKGYRIFSIQATNVASYE